MSYISTYLHQKILHTTYILHTIKLSPWWPKNDKKWLKIILLAACTEKVHADTINDDAACYHTSILSILHTLLDVWYLPILREFSLNFKKNKNSHLYIKKPQYHILYWAYSTETFPVHVPIYIQIKIYRGFKVEKLINIINAILPLIYLCVDRTRFFLNTYFF